MYDLGKAIEELERQKQKEVLPEKGILIDANRLISKLNNLHNEIDKIQEMVQKMKSKAQKK